MKKKWKTRYQQGIFKITEQEKKKYNGVYPIIYRSSWEKKFLYWVTNNNNIVKWNSESIVIPYRKFVDNKIHRYYVDFSIELKNGKKYLIEIKPEYQTKKPIRGKKREKTFLKECVNYKINSAKWKAATEWGIKHGYEFKLITERELKIK